MTIRVETLTLASGARVEAIRDVAAVRRLSAALEALMPFILEDYFPDCATAAYVAAVVEARKLTGM